jgi:hypothetical protein
MTFKERVWVEMDWICPGWLRWLQGEGWGWAAYRPALISKKPTMQGSVSFDAEHRKYR